MIYINGLSNGDIRSYYGGSILSSPRGFFMVDDWEGHRFRGNILNGTVWEPANFNSEELSFIFPREGYIYHKNNIYQVNHTIHRTRRKGYNTENYNVRGISCSSNITAIDRTALNTIFSNAKSRDWKHALAEVNRTSTKGFVFSKDFCLFKTKGDTVLLGRGQPIGMLSKREVVKLPKEHKTFVDELNEYNIPTEVVNAS